jgi:hypothetical protein
LSLFHARQHLDHGVQVEFRPLMRRELDVIQIDAERVSERALHDAHETGDIAREIGGQVVVLARVDNLLVGRAYQTW